MSEKYLTLHKVRGEPAFDVAVKLEIDEKEHGEEIWINPTSGHRIYPYQKWPLYLLNLTPGHPEELTVPTDWPDHYQNVRSSSVEAPNINWNKIVNEFRPVFKRRF